MFDVALDSPQVASCFVYRCSVARLGFFSFVAEEVCCSVSRSWVSCASRLCQDPRITMFLLPSLATSKAVDKEPPKKPSTAGPSQAAAKSTGGNKRRKTRAEKGCPEELKKFQLRCEHGPVCWAYNLKSGCKNATTGKPSRCAKGFHVCANCHKPGHSVTVCRGLTKTDGA